MWLHRGCKIHQQRNRAICSAVGLQVANRPERHNLVDFRRCFQLCHVIVEGIWQAVRSNQWHRYSCSVCPRDFNYTARVDWTAAVREAIPGTTVGHYLPHRACENSLINRHHYAGIACFLVRWMWASCQTVGICIRLNLHERARKL